MVFLTIMWFWSKINGVLLTLSVLLPIVVTMTLFFVQKQKRKSQLTAYVDQWNRSRGNGVTISLGARGIQPVGPGVYQQVDTETYDSFVRASMVAKTWWLMGYLHVIVNHQVRPAVQCTYICTLYTALYTVHISVHCTLHCTLYIYMYTVHCTLYIYLASP